VPDIRTESVRISPRLLVLIAEIDEFKGAWAAVGRLEPERLRSLRRVATIESIGSSTRIEGARLTDAQVERLLSNLTVGSFASRDEQEVAGYATVMELVFESHAHMPITESVIRQLHRDLLRFSDKDARHRGSWKTMPNSVEAFDADGRSLGVVFETATPFDTPRRMAELVAWHDDATRSGELHPLLVIAIFIVVFLEIHPFQDGNGRLSRILTTLMLLRAGYDYVPYSSIESIIERHKEQYYLALRRTQRTIHRAEPDWEPWIDFLVGTLHAHMQHLRTKVEREEAAFAALPELSIRLIELAREHGRITVADAVELTGASRNTIKKHLQRLCERERLVQHGRGRGTWYAER